MAEVEKKELKAENVFPDFDYYSDAEVTKGYGIAFTFDDIDPIAMLNYIKNTDEDAYNAIQNGECHEFSKITMSDLTAEDVEMALEWYGTHFVELICDDLNREYVNAFTSEENMESTVWFIVFEAKFPWEYKNSYPYDSKEVRNIISGFFEDNGLWVNDTDMEDMFGYYNIFRMNCF